MSDEFTCWKCKVTFPKGWSDEEAIEEYKRDYPHLMDRKTDVLCDYCYEEFNNWLAKIPVWRRKEMEEEKDTPNND